MHIPELLIGLEKVKHKVSSSVSFVVSKDIYALF